MPEVLLNLAWNLELFSDTGSVVSFGKNILFNVICKLCVCVCICVIIRSSGDRGETLNRYNSAAGFANRT